MAGVKVEVVGVAVCDNAAYFNDKVAADIAHWQALNPSAQLVREPVFRTLDAYVGAGYAKVGEDELALLLELARKEGVLLDPVYTGKAFLGLERELQAGRLSEGDDIVFVHTGGGFGVFPYEEQLAAIF
jgi:D-cysteine desulfhydrase